MRTMHLFAGVGGGLLADLILGHRPIVAVEWDKYACQVLRERAAEGWFPDLRVWEGDVRLFDPSEYAGQVDCIHAGFPCQDISVAGKQAGVGEETRSGLYREVLRIAGVVRPKYLFLENVAAIVTNGLDTVIGDLTKIGYDAEWLCLRASDCGAKHHRDRWWCLCHAKHAGWDAAEISRSLAQGSNDHPTGEKQAKQSAGSSDADLAYTDSLQWGASVMEKDTEANWRNDTSRRSFVVSNASSEGLERQREVSSGISKKQHDISDSCWWGTESGLGELVDGVSNRVCSNEGKVNANALKDSARQDLQDVRQGIQSESNAEWKKAGCEAVFEARVLQPVVCEHARNDDPDCSRLLVQSEEASKGLLRGLRLHEGTSCSPHRPKQDEQSTGEHSDALQTLPQLLAHSTKTNEEGNCRTNAVFGYWEIEPDIGRVATGIRNRVKQLKGLGNAQVPLQAAVAWKLLGGE